MKCQVCQADLSAGATFCTNCGTPVPSNPYGSPSSPNQGIAPTMMASSTPPSDPYGQPSSGPYGQPPSNPYGQPSSPYGLPSTSYGADTPPPNPYNVPPANPYGAPPQPAFDPNAGAYGTPGAYGQPPYVPQQQKKKGPNGCVIALIIVAVIFVLGVSGIIALGVIGANAAKGIINNANATLTADAGTVGAFDTPTVGSNGSTPSTSNGVPNASQIDPTAASNLNHVQTASAVDANYEPTKVTSNFTTSDTVYLTYNLSGKAGYVIEKTYDATGAIAIQSSSPHVIDKGDTNGYISLSGNDIGSYTTGIFWCQQSDCSDAALAAVVTFTVA